MSLSSLLCSSVVLEIEERKLRSANVLLFNIAESTASSIAQKIEDDLKQVASILAPLGSFPKPNKVIRLGNSKPNVVRPLKIIYDNEASVKDVLRSNKINPNRKYHFRPDLTKLQRDYNNKVRDEFHDRLSKGESDVALKYKDNLLHITKKRFSVDLSKK